MDDTQPPQNSPLYPFNDIPTVPNESIKHPFSANKAIILLPVILLGIAAGVALMSPEKKAGLPSKAAGDPVLVSVLPASVSVPPAKAVSISINPVNRQLGFIRLSIAFNPAKIKISGDVVTNENYNTISKTAVATANTTGKMVVILGGNPDNLSVIPASTFEFAHFNIDAVGSTASTDTLTINTTDSQTVDMNSNELPHTVTASTVVVNGGQTGPTVTNTQGAVRSPTPSRTPVPSRTPTASRTPVPSRTPTVIPGQPSPTPNSNPPLCGQSSIPPQTGSAPLAVTLHGAANAGSGTGFDGYQWDYDGNGTWDSIVEPNAVTHMYEIAGSYVPKFRIHGTNNVWSSTCTYPYTVVVDEDIIDPTPIPTIPPQDKVPGDINGDGCTDYRDFRIVFAYYMMGIEEPAFDFSGDGVFTFRDIVNMFTLLGKGNCENRFLFLKW